MWTCKNCGEIHDNNFESCWNCGSEKADCDSEQENLEKALMDRAAELENHKNDEDAIEIYRQVMELFPGTESANHASQKISMILSQKSKTECFIPPVIVVTSERIPNCTNLKVIDIVSGECCLGISIMDDFLTGIRDIVGGRSATIERMLKRGKEECIITLKREAHGLGANAVIAVDIKYNQISGQGKSMLFVTATGTAVKVE